MLRSLGGNGFWEFLSVLLFFAFPNIQPIVLGIFIVFNDL